MDLFLRSDAKVDELEDCQRYNGIDIKGSIINLGRFVVLILDEMKIQEDLVYDKTGQRLHGFVNLGNVNSDLQKLESQVADDTTPTGSIATHMLTLMVRRIFFKMEFPYANFPTQGTVKLHALLNCMLRSNWSFPLLDNVGSCTPFGRDRFEGYLIFVEMICIIF